MEVIDKKFVVQDCEVIPNSHIVYIRKCMYCGDQHMHGAGSKDWGERVQVVDGVRTLGHRVKHCVRKNVKITLADGTEVCNESGYYLGIGDQVPG